MKSIGPMILQKAKDILCEQIDTYAVEIDKAYIRQDNELTVGLQLKFSPVGDKVKLQYQISFVADRVKDGDYMVIDEKQMQLPGVESVTLEYEGRVVKLGGEK